MALLRLYTLDRPRVGSDTGEGAGLPAGKPLALLAWIRLHPGGVTRDAVAPLLWPGSPDARARASVRQALWTIRKRLGPEVLREDGDGRLSIPPDALETDLDDLGDALARMDAQDVVRLWNGGPFQGFTIPGAPAWNHWASELHSEWERRVGEFLEAFAASQPVDQRWVWTGHAVSLRPYLGAAHAKHVRALLEAGHKDKVEEALARARSQAAGDGEEELAAVEAAVRDVVHTRLQSLNEPALVLPFVGRRAEFAALSSALEGTTDDRSATVCLLGTPGIGKTTLAMEFRRLAEAQGVQVVGATGAYGEREVPFGVVGVLCRRLLRMPGAAGISRASARVLSALVPSASDRTSHLSARPSTAALGDALVDLLDAVAEETPLLLFVDDLHWVDDPSRSLLQRAMRLVPRRPVLLLATCRSELGDPGVVRSLAAEAERGSVEILEVGPLSVGDVEELLEGSVGFNDAQQRRGLAAQLHEASRGHPLHATSLLRSLHERGVFILRNGAWVFDDRNLKGPLEMPQGLRDMLRERLYATSEDGRTVLEKLVQRDEPRRVAALRRATDLSEARFSQALADLQAAELVYWADEERVDFSHALLREAMGPGSPGRAAPRWWARVAAVVGLSLIGLGAAWYTGLRDEAVPWSGTVMSVQYGERLEELAALPSGEWFVSRTYGDLADVERDSTAVDTAFLPWFRVDYLGEEVVLGSRRIPARGPDIVALYDDGRLEAVVDDGGDQGLFDIDPSGRFVLLTVEDTTASQYRLDLELLDLETGTRRVVFSPEFRTVGRWSPDGKVINVLDLTLQGPDELFRIRPDGSIVARAVLPEGVGSTLATCGPDDVLVHLLEPLKLPEWHRYDWSSGQVSALPAAVAGASRVTCSPDGSYYAYSGPDRPGEVVIVARSDGSTAGVIPLTDGAGGDLRWVDPRTSVPRRVSAAGPAALGWGQAGAFRAAVFDQFGRRIAGAEPTWRSLDPLVVGIRGDSAIGNGPGTARIVAEVDGWIRDTVVVQVTGTPGAGVLLAERFDTSWTERWGTIGEPRPSLVQFEGSQVLDAGGDAVWLDAIHSNQRLPVERGLTAEVQFRLPLTERLDRQSVRICLLDADVDPTGIGVPRRGSYGACTMYPQGELNRFSRDHLALYSWRGPVVIGIPAPGLGGAEWSSIGLQIRPDGQVSALVNGAPVGDLPRSERFPPGLSVRVLVSGRAEDTELLLRSVTVWEGPRY